MSRVFLFALTFSIIPFCLPGQTTLFPGDLLILGLASNVGGDVARTRILTGDAADKIVSLVDKDSKLFAQFAESPLDVAHASVGPSRFVLPAGITTVLLCEAVVESEQALQQDCIL